MTGMWACPECGRSFASRHQVHTCAALGDLDQHFTRASPQVRATFDTVLAAVSALGPVPQRRPGLRDGPARGRTGVRGQHEGSSGLHQPRLRRRCCWAPTR